MITGNIFVTLCLTRHTYVSKARAWVHVDTYLSACPHTPAAIVARNEGLAFARWQLSRGEFAIKRDDIIYRWTSCSCEKEVADSGLLEMGTDRGMSPADVARAPSVR